MQADKPAMEALANAETTVSEVRAEQEAERKRREVERWAKDRGKYGPKW